MATTDETEVAQAMLDFQPEGGEGAEEDGEPSEPALASSATEGTPGMVVVR